MRARPPGIRPPARRARAASALAVVVMVLAGCSTGTDAVNQMSGSDKGYVTGGSTTRFYPAGGRPVAPSFGGTLLDGGSFDLAGEHGHVVVVNFWGSWCSTCRVEAADLESTASATAAQGVVFVGVNLRDDHDGATAYEQEYKLTYPSIFDPGGRVALQFRDVPPAAIPSTLVIDATGRIASIHLGTVTHGDLADMITKASS